MGQPAEGKQQNVPFHFFLSYFLPKGWPRENLRAEKWKKKKNTQSNILKLTKTKRKVHSKSVSVAGSDNYLIILFDLFGAA